MDNNFSSFLDQDTPLNAPLKGKYKKSFAYHSLMHRMPDIFYVTIDSLKSEKFNLDISDDVNNIVENLKLLLSEILDNKPLRKIDSTSNLSFKWNQILDEKFKTDSTVTWFDTDWLFTENYLYVRIREIFEKSKTLQNYDPFKQLKKEAFDDSKDTMESITKYLLLIFSETEKEEEEYKEYDEYEVEEEYDDTKLLKQFLQILKLCLWGNRFDLSLNIGKSTNSINDTFHSMANLDKYILTDHSEKIWNMLNALKTNSPKRIDIVMDNSAYELFTDLCLADYLITYGYADVVVFHGKAIPWYVSDVTGLDFKQFLYFLEKESMSSSLEQIGSRWSSYYSSGRFVIETEDFWTLPYNYSTMATVDSELYKQLISSQLVIFKGDLNYRKLIGDINWSPKTTFKQALRGFHPTHIVALRTLKCDCVCDLNPDYETKIDENHKNNNYISSDNYWQVNGKYAVIHFCK